MKYCPNCKVDVNSSRKRCPLCYEILKDNKEQITSQNYPKKHIKQKMSLTTRILLFTSIVVVVASIITNVMTIDKTQPLYWCVLVVVGIPYIWLSVRYVILSKGNIPTKIFSETLSTLLLVVLVDIIIKLTSGIDGAKLWSLDYVVPSLFVLTSVSMFVITTIIKKLYCDAIVYLFAFIGLEIAYFLLHIFTNLISVEWMGITVIGVAGALLLAMFIFHYDDTKEEFIKRFHA